MSETHKIKIEVCKNNNGIIDYEALVDGERFYCAIKETEVRKAIDSEGSLRPLIGRLYDKYEAKNGSA